MTALVLVEHEGGAVKDATLAAVTAAAKLGAIHALVAGDPAEAKAAAAAAAKIAGVEKVLLAADAAYAHALPENVAPLAALTGRPQGTFASKVAVEGDHVTVTREVDGGLETVKLALPAIVTTDLRLNQPRYASLPNIMKAKSKPLDTKTPADFGVDTAPRLKTLKVAEPPVRQAGVKVADVDELVAKMKALGIA